MAQSPGVLSIAVTTWLKKLQVKYWNNFEIFSSKPLEAWAVATKYPKSTAFKNHLNALSACTAAQHMV